MTTLQDKRFPKREMFVRKKLQDKTFPKREMFVRKTLQDKTFRCKTNLSGKEKCL
jgi:hypothetical protein